MYKMLTPSGANTATQHKLWQLTDVRQTHHHSLFHCSLVVLSILCFSMCYQWVAHLNPEGQVHLSGAGYETLDIAIRKINLSQTPTSCTRDAFRSY